MKSQESRFKNGLKEAQRLSAHLGKEVKTSLLTDKGSKQFLIGLKHTGVENSHYHWVAKIQYKCNQRLEEKWISVEDVEILI